MRRVLTGLALAATLGATGACGASPSALEQTEQNMAELTAADMDLRLSATAGSGDDESGPVGFRIRGPFSMDDDKELAVFDLTYTQLLGGESTETAVRSTGAAAFVETGGQFYKVGAEDLDSLRISEDRSGGFNDLGIAGWVKDPKTTERGRNEVITGEVNAGDLLSDLARIAGSLGGDGQVSGLDGEQADRLGRLVKKSAIEVVTNKDRELQSLKAELDFGARAPEELRRTLGKYAAAKLEITLAMKELTRPLRVTEPDDFLTL